MISKPPHPRWVIIQRVRGSTQDGAGKSIPRSSLVVNFSVERRSRLTRLSPLGGPRSAGSVARSSNPHKKECICEKSPVSVFAQPIYYLSTVLFCFSPFSLLRLVTVCLLAHPIYYPGSFSFFVSLSPSL